MRSQKLHQVDGPQRELTLANPQPIAEEVVFRQPTFTAAIKLAANASGLEEKQIYRELDIDAGHWTRILNGDAHFPVDKLTQFMDLVGNEVPLQWLAHRRGKGLVVLESESQRLLRIEQEKNAKLAGENALLRDLVQGKA